MFATPICRRTNAVSTAGSIRTRLQLRQIGNFGNAAKGVIKGPDVNVWHVGFFKSFYFSEKVRVRWELTATNFFNHPNYNNPATNIAQAGAVGVITGVGAVNGASTGDQPGARAFRMGLRIEW